MSGNSIKIGVFLCTIFTVFSTTTLGHAQVVDPVRVDESTDQLRANALGWVEVIGEVVNTSSQIVGSVKVVITLKNAAGQILDTDFAFVQGKDVEISGAMSSAGIFPNERASFNETFSSVSLDSVATVEYVVSYSVANPRTDISESTIMTRLSNLEQALGISPTQGLVTHSTIDSLKSNLNARIDSLSILNARFDSLKTVVDSIKAATPTESPNTLLGDFNLDGQVGFDDFITFAQNFGKKS